MHAVFDMIEYVMVKAGVTQKLHSIPQWATRAIYRTIYCVFVGFIAILLPFFGGDYRFLSVHFACRHCCCVCLSTPPLAKPGHYGSRCMMLLSGVHMPCVANSVLHNMWQQLRLLIQTRLLSDGGVPMESQAVLSELLKLGCATDLLGFIGAVGFGPTTFSK